MSTLFECCHVFTDNIREHQMEELPEGPMLDLVLASLDLDSLANLYFTNSTLRELVYRYLEMNDFSLPGAGDELIKTAYEGNSQGVQFALLAGANVNTMGDAPLRKASEQGNAEVVQILLNAGADVHAMNDWVLVIASKHGHEEIVRMLLNADAYVDGSAITTALDNGYRKIARILLEATTKHRINYDHLLIRASINGYKEIIRTLLDFGLHKPDLTMAIAIASREGHKEIAQMLR